METISISSSVEISLCGACNEPRSLAVRCVHCGDRLKETSMLSPYERLSLIPRPLYHEQEVRAAAEVLFDDFHALKSSRHLARWSLRQRALICRDASVLCSLSGALGCYLRLKVNQQSIEDLPNSWQTVVTRISSWSVSLKLSLELLTSLKSFPNSASTSQMIEHSSLYSLALERHLLDDAYRELEEYDGYQERERLFNRFTREYLAYARKIAEALITNNTSEDWPILAEQIRTLYYLEKWLEERRSSSTSTLT